MDITVLNEFLEADAVLDVFESAIWTDRYYGCGDFQIAALPSPDFVSMISSGAYLSIKNSEHIMVIEILNIKSDVQTGAIATLKGRSLESILDRRIIWDQTYLTGSFQDGIEQLLNENAIDPSDTTRKIERLDFEASTDPIILAMSVDCQYFGDNLYKAITELCMSQNVGFKITLTDTNRFKFKLYYGVDRSYDQLDNPYIVFSPEFENLINSDYVVASQLLKTVTLIAGEKGVGNVRRTITAEMTGGAGSDLGRREMFTDAAGVSKNVPGGVVLTDEEYLAELTQKGLEDLAKNTVVESFNGQADISNEYVWGTDFNMGDILQIADGYGHETKSRVIEMIHSQDATGSKAYPTFSGIQ